MALGLGLHDIRAVAGVFEPYTVRKKSAKNVFWTLFVKDQVYNFHAGLPFGITLADSSLAEPVSSLL